MRSFADIPAEVTRRIAGGERVVLTLLDALGRELLERESDHPLYERLQITALDSQFPSTTTAHVTTLHFGVPVERHGLYEWRVLEPSLDEIIVPLPFRRDTSEVPDELTGTLDPRVLAPGPTFYEQLGARSLVAEPAGIAGSYDALATTGARRVAFTELGEGLAQLVDAFDDDPALRYAFLYWGEIDTVGHHHGPGDPRFRAAARAALDVLHARAGELTSRGVTVLLTADHGMVDVAPDRVDHLDRIWPPLTELLTQRAAGSARDVFLHVAAGETDRVVDELSGRLGGGARVCRATDLFTDPAPGPRLLARLGDVAVLPAPGRQAWLAATPSVETWMRGMHGGRTSAETATYLAQIVG